MNIKVYKSELRDDLGRVTRRGCVESYYTRADGSAAITKEWFGVTPDGLKVELWARLENSDKDVEDSENATLKGFAAAKQAAAKSAAAQAEFGLSRTIAKMPEGIDPALSPFDFFEKAGAALGIYRVDVDGEIYWPMLEE